MIEEKIIEEIKAFSKNVEKELSSFEINLNEGKKKLIEVEAYIKEKFSETHEQIKQLKKSNNCDTIPKIVDVLIEIQNIIERFNIDVEEIKDGIFV